MAETLYDWCINNNRTDILSRWSKNNDISYQEINYGSSKKVLWVCSKGHEWHASPNKITQKTGEGCPYCANQKVLAGYNDLEYLFPNIALEWNKEKNINITASEISAHSNKKVWWKCKNNHEYQMSPGDRTGRRARGCPICANKKLVIGINDLATVCPEVVNEWHPIKNGVLKPADVFASSSRKIWWICSKGHEYEASLNNRIKNNNINTGCPICCNKIIISGINDLASKNPELLDEWDYKKNDVSPYEIGPGTHEKYWWKCQMGHSYQASPENRTKAKGTGCPKCAKEMQTSFPEQALFYYLKQIYPMTINRWTKLGKEIDIYIPELLVGIEYDGKRYHTNEKRTAELEKDEFFRERGIKIVRIKEYIGEHENIDDVIWVNERANQYDNIKYALNVLHKQLGIPATKISIEIDAPRIISQYYISKKANSLASKYPSVSTEWDYELNNDVTPEQVSAASAKKFWWKCKRGHSYCMSVDSRTSKGTGCPFCAGQRLLVGFNDLASRYPKIAKEWDDELNGELTPNEVMPGTHRRVYWRCDKGHSYQASINSRTNCKSGCPYCSGYKVIIGENDLATINPEVAIYWDYEKNYTEPSDVKPFSHKKVWWKCNLGHSYNREISAVVLSQGKKGDGCPYCAHSRVLSGFNDLEKLYPDVAKMWDYAKNDLKPSEVMPYSTKKAWWNFDGESKFLRIDYVVEKYRDNKY